MAQKVNITHQESIDQNLETWCYEVGTHYEEYSKVAAQRFIKYIRKGNVVDLGSGDGAATNVFVNNGNKTVAVDINPEKLMKIKGAKLELTDFLGYLKKSVDNIFCHHALEHYVDYEKVIAAIGKYLKKGCYCYIAVPKGDKPHSVHHVAFESLDEITPKGLEVIEAVETNDPWPEYYVIARKN